MTQLYIYFSPSELSSHINALQLCSAFLDSWFCENGLALNRTKSDAILFGMHQRLESLTSLNFFNVAGADVSLADHVNIYLVQFSSLTMDNHTKAVSKSCFYHICSFRQARSSLDDSILLVLLLYFQRIRGFTTMRYINRLFTYLLTYLLTYYLNF